MKSKQWVDILCIFGNNNSWNTFLSIFVPVSMIWAYDWIKMTMVLGIIKISISASDIYLGHMKNQQSTINGHLSLSVLIPHYHTQLTCKWFIDVALTTAFVQDAVRVGCAVVSIHINFNFARLL